MGLGTDLVDIERFRKVSLRRPSIIKRLFSDAEADYSYGHANPWPHFAVRFAAKEAVLKAMSAGLGVGSLAEIEVVRSVSGAPSVVLAGRTAELAASRGVHWWRCSLSHTAHVAEAVVLAWGDPPHS